jgi:COMPASS component SWD2
LSGPLIDVGLAEISQPPPRPVITSISFSNDGNYLLVGTSFDIHYVLDAFTLLIVRRLIGHQGLERNREGQKVVQNRRGASGEEVCWSSDSRWVISGSADGSVYMWDMAPPGQERPQVDPSLDTLRDKHEKHFRLAKSMEPSVVLPGRGMGASRAVAMNPRYLMMAVGGDDLVRHACSRLTVQLIGNVQSFWLTAKEEDNKVEEGW